jgi:hypothetical protein
MHGLMSALERQPIFEDHVNKEYMHDWLKMGTKPMMWSPWKLDWPKKGIVATKSDSKQDANLEAFQIEKGTKSSTLNI